MHKPCLFSFNLSFWKLLILQNISKEGRQNLIDVHHIPSQFENFTTAQWTHICRFPSLGKPWLDLEYLCWNTDVGHMNSYVGIPMSNIGIQTLVCSILPQFLPNLMILWLDCIYHHLLVQYTLKNHQIWQKSGQKWENPHWNSYVGHWNSDVGIPMSNLGIPR